MITARVVSTRSDLPTLRAALGCPPVGAGSTIVLDRLAGQGGTGTVSRASVTGAAGAPILVKRFERSLGERALRLVSELHAALNARPDRDWTVYAAGLPFWAGELDDGNGRPEPALAMADLGAAGFVPLEAILDEGGTDLFDLTLVERIGLAGSFAEGQAFWDQIGFVHADINPPNIFVNLSERRAVCIDFDMGGLQGSVSCHVPLARGKPDEFLAPEVAAGADPGIMSDNWATGVTLGYLLLGCHPLFFLADLSPAAVTRYLGEQVWPNADRTSDLINPSTGELYDEWRDELDQLPADTVERFADLVAGIFDPPRRPAPIAWAFSLHPSPPTFERVDATALVLAGDPVTVSWSARLASTVSVDARTGLAAQGSLTFTPARSGTVTLRAENPSGAVTATVSFTVARLPDAPTVTPSAPRLRPSTATPAPHAPPWRSLLRLAAWTATASRPPSAPSWSVTSV